MGLAAVLFGAAYHDWGLSLPAAAMVALLAGCAGGALNAVLIARFNIPPLIVTLGTFSLFRGIAEGLTHGAVNYTNFPARFLSLGQGYLWGVIPTQLLLFLAILSVYAIVLHRSVVGRAWYALGHGRGARYAESGRPARRRALSLSGLVSSVAAIVYVAHLGQANQCVVRIRARRDHRGRSWRHVGLRWTRDAVGHGAGSLAALSILRNGLHLRRCPRS